MPIGIVAGKDLSANLVPMGNIVPFFLGILSLAGSVYAIRELRKSSDRWYFAVPYAIALVILCISYSLGLAWGHGLDFFYISQVLAAITSTGFFLSFPEPERNPTRFFAVVSGVISICVIGSIFMLVPDLFHPGRPEFFIGILILSLLIALPVVGVCFVVTAFLVREKVSPGFQN